METVKAFCITASCHWVICHRLPWKCSPELTHPEGIQHSVYPQEPGTQKGQAPAPHPMPPGLTGSGRALPQCPWTLGLEAILTGFCVFLAHKPR